MSDDPDSPSGARPDPESFGCWIPPSVWNHDVLTTARKAYLGRLIPLMMRPEGCTASNEYLSDVLGISASSIRRLLADLEDQGFVERRVEKKKFGSVRHITPGPELGATVQNRAVGACRTGRGGVQNRAVQYGEEEKRDRVGEENTHTSEIQGDLLGGSRNGDGEDVLERVVDEVWEHTFAAWKDRVGNQPGPDLQRTDARETKIRARGREVLDCGARPEDAIVYLSVAARGFYADDWERRDEYLDPGKYCFDDDQTVRRYYRQGRREELGLTKADAKRADRVAEILSNGA